jgi:DNA-binding transcriptional MerR regulator/methanogenic corrinoid protein MtbC1
MATFSSSQRGASRGIAMSEHEGSIEWPDLERYSDTPMFNTKAIVQQTGVPAPTLRAWERRYALIAPERGDNAYRLYSERHIVLIRWLKERIDSGISISQSIALFRHMNEEHERAQSEVPDLSSQAKLEVLPDIAPSFHVAIAPPELSSEQIKQEDPLQPLQEWPMLGSEQMHPGYPSTHDMAMTKERLIETFRNLDEPMAHVIMGTILSIYPVEQVCIELITPTMHQVGQLWTDKHLTVPEEHFATNFFRALLTNLFYITPGPLIGPHTFVCCTPGEPHELGALMLALFLRRRGIRVVYMGQSIETAGLIHTISKIMPVLICVSLSMPNYLSALISLGRQIQMMPPPRPMLAFGGGIFLQPQYANITDQIPGIYLQDDLRTSADRLRALIVERSESKN